MTRTVMMVSLLTCFATACAPGAQRRLEPGAIESVPALVEPEPTPVDAQAAAAQDAYEAATLVRLAELSTQIRDLNVRSQQLLNFERVDILPTIEIARERRAVVMTELERLSRAPATRWASYKPAVDQAVVDLESSIKVSEESLDQGSFLAH